jgi:outer membrane protein
MSIFAQDKIAYINANEIFSKMPELKDVETKLAAKSEIIKKTATGIEAEYTKKVEEFQKDTTNLSESILLDRQTQLDGLRDRYQNFIQTSQSEFEKEQQSLIAPIQQKMKQAIKEVGDENNYAYILDAATLLHIGSHATDASKMVKAKLGITD